MASSSDPKVSVTTKTGIDVDKNKEKAIKQYNFDCATTETDTKIENSLKVLQRYAYLYSSKDKNESNEQFKNVRDEDRRMNKKPRIVDYEMIQKYGYSGVPKSFILGGNPDSFRIKKITTNDSNTIDTKKTTTTQSKIEQLRSMLQAEGERIKEEINRLIKLTDDYHDEKEMAVESTQEQNKCQMNNKRKIVVKNGLKKDKQYQRTIIGLKAEVQRQKAIYAGEKSKWEREREELQRKLRNSESRLRKNQTDESSTQTSTDLEDELEVFQSLAKKWTKLCKCNSCISKNKLNKDKRDFKSNQDKISKKTSEYKCDICKKEFVSRVDYKEHNVISHGILLPKIVKDDERRLERMPACGKTVGIDERRQNEEHKKCVEPVEMDLQRSQQQEDEQVVVLDAAATSLEVITETLEDTLRITEPVVSNASTEETYQLDERMTNSEDEEILQGSMNVSKQDDVSTETLPATPIVSEKKIQTDEIIPKLNPISARKKRTLQRRFMSQLFRHQCEKNECSVVSMRSYALHADFCTDGMHCNLFVCQSIGDRSKHLRICEDELRCVICQYRIYFDEDRLQDMMEELEKNCPIVDGNMSNLEDKEALVLDMVQLAVDYGLIGYADKIQNLETGEMNVIYDDESSSDEEEEFSDGWELCG